MLNYPSIKEGPVKALCIYYPSWIYNDHPSTGTYIISDDTINDKIIVYRDSTALLADIIKNSNHLIEMIPSKDPEIPELSITMAWALLWAKRLIPHGHFPDYNIVIQSIESIIKALKPIAGEDIKINSALLILRSTRSPIFPGHQRKILDRIPPSLIKAELLTMG